MSKLDEPHRRHWIEYAATLVGLIVAVISLWVAIATERANQKMVDANYRMVAAASWPFLQLNSENNDSGKHTIALKLENAGVGPAKVQTFEVFWRGKAYAGSRTLLMACCIAGQKKPLSIATLPVTGTVLRAGDRREVLSLDLRPDNEVSWKAFDLVRQQELTYRACYCSVFDECWISDLSTLAAHRVKICPKPAVPYDQ